MLLRLSSCGHFPAERACHCQAATRRTAWRGGAGASSGARYRAAAHLSHTAQWESARLEAEARLAREARLRALAASASVSAPRAPPGPSAAAHGLESPTSTLSFSESAALASVLEAHGAAAAAAAARAAMEPMQAYEEACKEHEQQQWGDHVVVHAADAAFAGAGFTGLLLDGALNQQDLRPAAGRHDADADAGLQETEEEKNYWDSILNLVNSSSVSLPTSVVVPAPEAYSSSASLQTSVVVSTPEAYSSSASLTRSVEVPAPNPYSPAPALAPEF